MTTECIYCTSYYHACTTFCTSIQRLRTHSIIAYSNEIKIIALQISFYYSHILYNLGAIQVLRNADANIFRKKRYEGVMFNVISVTRGWVGVQFPEK